VRDTLNQLQFSLRNRTYGQLKLRSGLPATQPAGTEREFYRLVLSRAMGMTQDSQVQEVWDIGCRNWSYAQALAEFFPGASLVGVEIDGGRRYWNLYRRIDQAESYARELRDQGRQASVIYADFQKVHEHRQADDVLFCFFYPFVSENPCLSWGLPVEYSDFTSLIMHARKLADGAHILSCHQGEWEAELARESYRKAGVSVSEQVLHASEFAGLWPSPYDAHLFFGKF